MFKSIANKRVDLSEEEVVYFEKLRKEVGDDSFVDLFSSNSSGKITYVSPPLNKPTSMAAIFFIYNVMLNQKLRELDSIILKASSYISSLEEKNKNDKNV